MAKQIASRPSLVVMFVEGDTDEILFKALIDYYRTVSKTEIRPCRICNLKGVTRYSSKLLAKLQNEFLPEARSKVNRMGIEQFVQLGIKSSIEDWLLYDMEGICRYLNLATQPKSLKGSNGNAKLNDLFSKAKKTYQKGYQAKELVAALDLSVIRSKNSIILSPLEEALNVTII